MKPSLFLFGILGLMSPINALLAQAPAADKVVEAATAAAAATNADPVTLLSLIESGGWAMIPLALMSVATVMLVIVFSFTLRPGAIASAHFMNTSEVLLKKRDYPALLAIAHRHNELIARVVQRMLDFSTKNPTASFEVVREIAQTEGASQAASLQNRISYLADIAVLSPMVGLLGTVFGIIQSFGVIASNVSEASRPMLLAEGVSEALVATGTGLVVGIIAMAFYGLFRNRVQTLISELERASAQSLGLMALHFNAKPEEPRRERSRDGRRDWRDRDDEQPRQESPRKPSVSLDDDF
jgi:biopolymer transport protein ExbB